MTQEISTKSQCSFHNGDMLLILVSPDDPDAPTGSASKDKIWSIETRHTSGDIRGKRAARKTASLAHLLGEVFDVLYQTVSSNEVDRRHKEVEDLVHQVYQAYQVRRSQS